MTLQALRKEIRAAADPNIAEHSARFFKTGKGEYGEGDRFLGVRVPVIRKLVKRNMPLSQQDLLALLRSSYHEERLAALVGLVTLYERSGADERQQIYRQYLKNTGYINNWDLVDCSAHQIVGGYLLERDKKPLYRLVESKNLWERRIAIIATFFFIKQGRFEDTLKLSELLLQDQEDLIHKAVGWMLRELGKQGRELEEQFLQKYYRRMPRTMLRYAIEKFPEPLRKGYLNGTV